MLSRELTFSQITRCLIERTDSNSKSDSAISVFFGGGEGGVHKTDSVTPVLDLFLKEISLL